ncbi:hypothetical protein LOD99_5976 [Oopsacas minuta]|uniref:Uncharacterized protein n=1 Tax=Oopsacas minuta TaxID=111878 RepID=A0AAV7JN85_9METZ|nr:hypothetical protein LOD99_5976 [Oopsacas minuta]
MASRWREWDIEFKDNLVPNGQSIVSKQSYLEPKRIDQSNCMHYYIPSALLKIVELESKNRIKNDVILVSDVSSGKKYTYTRDGELQLKPQDIDEHSIKDMYSGTSSCTSLIREYTPTNNKQIRHSSCPNLVFSESVTQSMPHSSHMAGVDVDICGEGVGRAKLLKERAIKATALKEPNVSVVIYFHYCIQNWYRGI